ncbi:hypothetical protein K438DRAFT_1984414 [Mycena galopus ATCC 62051]|nr:hypothetical protein K438DRAFT_1984414 [Mycena galopus ATCC 62051]
MLQLPDLCTVVGTVWSVIVEVEDLQGMLDVAEFLVAWFTSSTWSVESFHALVKGVGGSRLDLAHLLLRHLGTCVRLAHDFEVEEYVPSVGAFLEFFFVSTGMLGARATGDRSLCDALLSLDIIPPLTRMAVIVSRCRHPAAFATLCHCLAPLVFVLATSPARSTVASSVEAGVLTIVVDCQSHPLTDPFVVSLLRDVLPKSTVRRSAIRRLSRAFFALHASAETASFSNPEVRAGWESLRALVESRTHVLRSFGFVPSYGRKCFHLVCGVPQLWSYLFLMSFSFARPI